MTAPLFDEMAVSGPTDANKSKNVARVDVDFGENKLRGSGDSDGALLFQREEVHATVFVAGNNALLIGDSEKALSHTGRGDPTGCYVMISVANLRPGSLIE